MQRKLGSFYVAVVLAVHIILIPAVCFLVWLPLGLGSHTKKLSWRCTCFFANDYIYVKYLLIFLINISALHGEGNVKVKGKGWYGLLFSLDLHHITTSTRFFTLKPPLDHSSSGRSTQPPPFLLSYLCHNSMQLLRATSNVPNRRAARSFTPQSVPATCTPTPLHHLLRWQVELLGLKLLSADKAHSSGS
jgi:hypothetical protein